MKERLSAIAKEYRVTFERVLLEYVKEEILSVLYEKGFGEYLWLRRWYRREEDPFFGREEKTLSFFYEESDRVLPRDGFVGGCAYDGDFMNKLMSHVLVQAKEIRFRSFEAYAHRLELEIEWNRMYVPLVIEILPLRESSVTPVKRDVDLMILKKVCALTCYPVENEAADRMGEILSKLELLGELEPYLYVYEIFKGNALAGVRFQSALKAVLSKKGIPFSGSNLQTVLGYRNYSYMKKKWKVLLRRQKILSPSWEEVIDLLSSAILPIWEVSGRDEVFFGDWMPEIGRYLD